MYSRPFLFDGRMFGWLGFTFSTIPATRILCFGNIPASKHFHISDQYQVWILCKNIIDLGVICTRGVCDGPALPFCEECVYHNQDTSTINFRILVPSLFLLPTLKPCYFLPTLSICCNIFTLSFPSRFASSSDLMSTTYANFSTWFFLQFCCFYFSQYLHLN